MLWVIYITALLGGLFVGSFLNVVIHRGPALWGLAGEDRRTRGTLMGPRSYCPQCKTQIRIIDLLPLFSFLRLRGKCAACGAPISPRYPIVELLGGVAAIASVAIYGVSLAAAFTAIFLFALIALASIDLETQYLPDAITLPLIAAGLLVNAADFFVTLEEALIGAAAGFIGFWLIGAVYERFRGREGLGQGDAKLLAAIGAWLGWAALAPTVLLAALSTLVVIGAQALSGRKLDKTAPIPFGPALCAAGAVMMIAAGGDWIDAVS